MVDAPGPVMTSRKIEFPKVFGYWHIARSSAEYDTARAIQCFGRLRPIPRQALAPLRTAMWAGIPRAS